MVQYGEFVDLKYYYVSQNINQSPSITIEFHQNLLQLKNNYAL